MAAALAACKILREMSHLETGAGVRRPVREAKYEQLALGEHRPGGHRRTRWGGVHWGGGAHEVGAQGHLRASS